MLTSTGKGHEFRKPFIFPPLEFKVSLNSLMINLVFIDGFFTQTANTTQQKATPNRAPLHMVMVGIGQKVEQTGL